MMFILDDFYYKGRYYWYNKGNDMPKRKNKTLIYNKLSGRV